MRLDELFDLGRVGPPFKPRDGSLPLHEDECRHPPHVEPLRKLRPLLDVDSRHAQPVPFLPRKLREEAVHSSRRARSPLGEEDEKWSKNPVSAAAAPGPPCSGHRKCLVPARGPTKRRLDRVGDWYSVGVFTGLGVALGIAAAAGLGGRRVSLVAPFIAAAVGIALGVLLAGAEEAAGGGVGGVLGAAGSLELVRGSLGRGGTRTAIGFLVAAGALVVAALAFVPGAGYVEAVVLPALGMRLRRRGAKRYAGLRTLARD